MAVDAALLGEHVVGMMDELQGLEGELVGCAIVAVVVDERGNEDTRVVTSAETRFARVGLLRAGLETAEAGDPIQPLDDDDVPDLPD